MASKHAKNFGTAAVTLFLGMLMTLGTVSTVQAHCEIPCGIYNDMVRLVMLEEDIGTVEKSMEQITALSSEQPANYNQLVRWVVNKDNHASKIQETVTQYFMTQRIKPVADGNGEDGQKYQRELALLHGLLVHAMKAKQTTDMAQVEKMRTLLGEFADSYLNEADRKHLKEHHGF